jgi:hypothetical protein
MDQLQYVMVGVMGMMGVALWKLSALMSAVFTQQNESLRKMTNAALAFSEDQRERMRIENERAKSEPPPAPPASANTADMMAEFDRQHEAELKALSPVS